LGWALFFFYSISKKIKISTHYQDFPDSETFGEVKRRTLSFVVKKPQNKRLMLTIRNSDHLNDDFIELKINNQCYELTPSEIAHFKDFQDSDFVDDDQVLMKRKGSARIGPGDRFELEYKTRSVVLTREGRFVHEMKVKYPLKIEVSGGEMMMSRMEIK